jgi:hypothetical protein
LIRSLLILRQRNLLQDIEYQRFLIQLAQDGGDLKASQYQSTMVQLAEIKRRIDRALARYTNRTAMSRKS